jgi:NAD(P)-dependent dehydrogenase (short-subunit alcohol dehydrogenase family)
MRLENKVAIITGVGTGIGEAIALRFAEEGARLVLNDIDEQALLRTKEKTGGIAVAGDIADENTGKRLAAAAIEKYGKLDVLVNNAANFTQIGVENASLADWQKVLNVNVIGTAMVTKYAIPHLKANGSGSIVNIASMSGIIAQPEFATYNSSKGAQIMMTRCLAMDLAPFKIRVNSICPGCILTSAVYREVERLGVTFEDWKSRVAPMHMLNRLGDPREVANAVLFLASDEASFITATELMVDGGYTAH